MERYLNLSGDSGVVAYEAEEYGIIVKFIGDGRTYRYSYASAGAENIEEMKRLAVAGRGLSTFIAEHVKHRYSSRFK